MSNKILIIVFSVVIGLILSLGAGYFIGVSLEQEKTGTQIQGLEKLTNVTSFLTSSKLISSIIVFGKVTNISGRTITLAVESENLQVSIKEGAQIYSFTAPVSVDGKMSGVPKQEVAEFKNIKIGDNLNINMKMLADGQAEGFSATIFPATFKTAQ